MVRVKRGNVARKRRKKILYLAKGFRGSHSKIFRIANEQVMKALTYSYVGRKKRKIQFRKLWITRINSFARSNFNIPYNKFLLLNEISGIIKKKKPNFILYGTGWLNFNIFCVNLMEFF